jgi:hypothetical protein
MARNRINNVDIGIQYKLESGRSIMNLDGSYKYDDLEHYARWLEDKLVEEINTQNAKDENKVENRRGSR